MKVRRGMGVFECRVSVARGHFSGPVCEKEDGSSRKRFGGNMGLKPKRNLEGNGTLGQVVLLSFQELIKLVSQPEVVVQEAGEKKLTHADPMLTHVCTSPCGQQEVTQAPGIPKHGLAGSLKPLAAMRSGAL